MKTVKLKKMELRNFKGVEKAEYEFSDICNIRGGNATGKSTIYEAYLWCLFDKNSYGQSPKVQPLDRQNNVIHKLTTSVKLHITLDDADDHRALVKRGMGEIARRARNGVQWHKERIRNQRSADDKDAIQRKTIRNYAARKVVHDIERWNHSEHGAESVQSSIAGHRAID